MNSARDREAIVINVFFRFQKTICDTGNKLFCSVCNWHKHSFPSAAFNRDMRKMLRPFGAKFYPTVLAFIFGCILLAPCASAETRYVEGEVIVTFKSAATLETAKAVLKRKS